MSDIDFKITKTAVNAPSRKLKATWSLSGPPTYMKMVKLTVWQRIVYSVKKLFRLRK